ncbi:hypothetical protein ONZ45_g12436 [Pleurotus djamor]|nr:hypothetical protein ONZ45_g12436 [Pleurotus djamor]
MLFKPAFIATAMLATLAATTPLDARTGEECTEKPYIECCTDVGTTSTIPGPLTTALAGPYFGLPAIVSVIIPLVLGVVGVTDVLGVNCSPLAAITDSCSTQKVCCENVGFNGLVNVGCNAISI